MVGALKDFFDALVHLGFVSAKKFAVVDGETILLKKQDRFKILYLSILRIKFKTSWRCVAMH